MLNKTIKIITIVLLTFGLFLTTGQKAEAKKKKVGFFTRVNRKIKRKCRRIAKKSRRAVVRAASGVQNKVMDSAVNAKSRITGKKKKRTFVRGHYKKGNRRHTSGHFRRVKRKKKTSGTSGGGGSYSSPAAPAGGDSYSSPTLPPYDGGMNFSKSSKKRKAKSRRRSKSRRRR